VKRVTADSNVWVSALIWGGKPLQLLELALQGEVELVISPDILNESLRVLREKIGLDVDDLQKAEDYIRRCTRLVEPTEKLDVVQSDPDDNRVLQCAVAADADTVVSGDLDLLRMGSFREIRILMVSEFLVGFQARER
jgi:putative PIN family toxin of toxin-antitoxin system